MPKERELHKYRMKQDSLYFQLFNIDKMIIIKKFKWNLLFSALLIIAGKSVFAANTEYLTLNVGGNPVVVVLAEHPMITYTDNTLHIQTVKETIDVPVSQITDMAFNETTAINIVENGDVQIQQGSILLQQLPIGSKVCIIAANGNELFSAVVDDNGQAVVNVSRLPKGVYVIKSAMQSIKITNK